MLIKTTKNKRSGKIKEKLVYPSIDNECYLYYNLRSDHNSKDKPYSISAHRLFGIVFNNNNYIFRNKDCDHIDRFRWCNKPENTRFVTSIENQNNRDICAGKINRKHYKKDIEYLKVWIAHVKSVPSKRNKIMTIKNEKIKYIDLLNNDL